MKVNKEFIEGIINDNVCHFCESKLNALIEKNPIDGELKLCFICSDIKCGSAFVPIITLEPFPKNIKIEMKIEVE